MKLRVFSEDHHGPVVTPTRLNRATPVKVQPPEPLDLTHPRVLTIPDLGSSDTSMASSSTYRFRLRSLVCSLDHTDNVLLQMDLATEFKWMNGQNLLL